MYLSSSSTIRRGVSVSMDKEDSPRTVLIGLRQDLHGHAVVGENADFRSYAKGLPGDLLGRQPAVLEQGSRGRQRVRTAGANGGHAVVRLNDIAAARQHEDMLLVGDNHQRFQAAEDSVRPPVLR